LLYPISLIVFEFNVIPIWCPDLLLASILLVRCNCVTISNGLFMVTIATTGAILRFVTTKSIREKMRERGDV